MSIEKKCENCVHKEYLSLYGIEYLCCESLYGKEDLSKCCDFRPTEEIVRQDERNKIITELEKIKKIVDDNGKSYIISANLLMIIEMIKEHKYE